MKIEKFVNELLDDRGINEKDKEELKYEITDHLMMLKHEFLEKGLDEEEAEKSSIKSFGDSNLIGNYIKTNLPSHNRYEDLSLEKKINCIIFMFLGVVGCVFVRYATQSTCVDSIGITVMSIVSAFVVAGISFLYVNIKISNIENIVKNILILNVGFFILDILFKLALNMTLAFLYSDFTFKVWDLLYPRMDIVGMTFNRYYICTFILLSCISAFIVKRFSHVLFRNVRNFNDSKLREVLFWIISVALTMCYLIIVSMPYKLHRVMYMITKDTEIFRKVVHKNIFYISLDNGFIIVNIGFVFIIVLLSKLIVKIKKKGLRSVF